MSDEKNLFLKSPEELESEFRNNSSNLNIPQEDESAEAIKEFDSLQMLRDSAIPSPDSVTKTA